jgi:aspartyl-tRNA(Asn)/glutamyl-tRNA(Gln) amidotransferase subunit C
MIDEGQVRHVAKLARLQLTDEELTRFSSQISAVLDYINQLKEVDTSSVEPMSHPLDLVNVFRKDEPTDSIPRDEALANAPQQRDGFFLVPPVLEWTSPEE